MPVTEPQIIDFKHREKMPTNFVSIIEEAHKQSDAHFPVRVVYDGIPMIIDGGSIDSGEALKGAKEFVNLATIRKEQGLDNTFTGWVNKSRMFETFNYTAQFSSLIFEEAIAFAKEKQQLVTFRLGDRLMVASPEDTAQQLGGAYARVLGRKETMRSANWEKMAVAIRPPFHQ